MIGRIKRSSSKSFHFGPHECVELVDVRIEMSTHVYTYDFIVAKKKSIITLGLLWLVLRFASNVPKFKAYSSAGCPSIWSATQFQVNTHTHINWVVSPAKMLHKIPSQIVRLRQCVKCNRSGNQFQLARYIHNVNYDEVYEKTKSLFQCKNITILIKFDMTSAR